MTKKGSSTQTESQKLSNQSRLYVPEPPFRPGDTPDYSHISVPADHTPVRPDPLCDAYDTVEHALKLIRVLRFNGESTGPWEPKISVEDKLRALVPDLSPTGDITGPGCIDERDDVPGFV